ncbi:FAD-binding oxidoreductase [Mesorhizobium mediterraneum]|uniref:Oxidoreductase n=3 Tax=Phyllobacteriaceae TaxID=69277 RepID=A0AB36R6P0_9HYPH|nr:MULTISPECIES: FAD-binding oxidoreductase [Mesorhizobium]PAQ00128.1 oxidoreductase [Mesorhizobium mediterraneum]RUU31377.1 FAD-binding oxidoreductase [Mesorhizobium sp. M6A.T.Ce.TU.016.01.1.1]RUU45450.1 FAD-binding oxidoreductase [Mesorhizobium sp. M6A.T.Ce.TU.002.03.1.1]RUV02745.1 FAD-binding oxidoreductase [Mesorhizobium sp. M6A.T.Cr.TU.017.01.1.1]RWN37264.1 MAG: FAD-binding oxidoreductase [Mesorhizobium sp.]
MDKPVTSYDFPDRLRASLIDQNHPVYEEARGLYNAMIDKRPRWIIPCAEVADVVAAVNYAREKHLLLAIRGGGHNGPGFGSCDGGMVIDMSPMKRVDIDPTTRTVRVEAGCTQGDVDRATSVHGLAVPAGIVATTGVAGLTLGGGTGHLTRKHGLTIDNLLAAEVVLADGSVVTASEDEHPELFWALRGGGGNFGVVTRFIFQAHPAKDVYAGPIFFDIADAAEIMRWYRDFLPGAPRELGMFFGIKTVPSCDPFPREIWGRRICALISCYNGAEEDGIRAMQPVRDALPKPLMDGMVQMPFVDLQALFDPLLPKGLQWYWKGDYVDELSDAAIAAHAEHGSKTPSELSLMHLYPIDGAVQDVAPDATAWGARRARWSMVIAGIDPDPTKASELRRWASEYWAAVHKHNPHGGAYINFMMDDEGEARVRAAYGANYERLVSVKRKYDPANLFRVNHNIRP